jgi:hypothetical protein
MGYPMPLKQGRQTTYATAQYPLLVPLAKEYLKENGMNLNLMLQQENFSVLKNSPDLKKYIKKFISNESRATKSVAGKLPMTSATSHGDFGNN